MSEKPTFKATPPLHPAPRRLLVAAAIGGIVLGSLGGGGCAPARRGAAPPPAATGAAPAGPRDMILATTTSVQDSGLLDLLIPQFEKASGYRVKTVAVGTGQALALAARGEADAVLVHAPAAEEKAVAAGIVVNRRPLMRNDFVIVGPPADPAGIRGLASAVEALRRIAAAGDREGTGGSPRVVFVSRGDDSGTHQKEKELWAQAGLSGGGLGGGGAGGGPGKAAAWYQETGQGMGQTLIIAWEKRAYTLTDRATYLALQARLDLEVLVEGDPLLNNPYHVMQVNPDRFPRVNAAGAQALIEFMVSPETQADIGRFGAEQYGRPLFLPAGGAAGP